LMKTAMNHKKGSNTMNKHEAPVTEETLEQEVLQEEAAEEEVIDTEALRHRRRAAEAGIVNQT